MSSNRTRRARMWQRVTKDMAAAAKRVEQVSRTLAMDAGVQAGISRTGHVTLRCETCGKVCYKDQQCAEDAVAKIPDPMTAYRSEKCGGWWHLATVRNRRAVSD